MFRTTLVLVVLLGLQAFSPAQALSPGTVSGNTYSNTDLGITYNFPVGWSAAPESDRGVLDVRFTPSNADGSEIEMFVLDSSLFPRATPLRMSRKSDMGAKYEFERLLPNQNIGGREFLRTDWIREAGKKKLYHSRLATDAKGWRLILFVSAPKRKGLDQEIDALSSLQFQPTRAIESMAGPVLQPPIKDQSGMKRLLKGVPPTYPQSARQSGRQGSVLLEVAIGKDGKIRDVDPIAGDPVFVGPATEAVRQWEYRPYVVDGTPVDVYTIVTVNFTLGGP